MTDEQLWAEKARVHKNGFVQGVAKSMAILMDRVADLKNSARLEKEAGHPERELIFREAAAATRQTVEALRGLKDSAL